MLDRVWPVHEAIRADFYIPAAPAPHPRTIAPLHPSYEVFTQRLHCVYDLFQAYLFSCESHLYATEA